jgi:hypothetical protein
MRDVRTKINNWRDKELNFLKSDFLGNNLQSSVFNLQVFSKIKPNLRNLSKSLMKELKFTRSNLRFLVSYFQVFFKMAWGVRGLSIKLKIQNKYIIWHPLKNHELNNEFVDRKMTSWEFFLPTIKNYCLFYKYKNTVISL